MTTPHPTQRALDIFGRQAMFRWLDDDGRPLGEQSVPALYAAAPLDERPCPYNDARRGRPMNVAALRQLSQTWEPLLAALAHLVAVASEGDPSGQLAWQLNAALSASPVALRLHEGVAGATPRLVSAAFKASLGFSRALPALVMASPDRAGRPMRDALAPEALFAWLERGEWLEGAQQVCAGSRRQIEQYHRVLLGERASDLPAPRWSDAFGVDALSLWRFTRVWCELMALTAAWCAITGWFVALGRLDEAPGFGAVDPDRARWPLGLRFIERRPAHEALRLARSEPMLDPVRLTWLYTEADCPDSLLELLGAVDPAADAPIGTVDATFAALLPDLTARLVQALGLDPAGVRLDVEASLVALDPGPPCRPPDAGLPWPD